MWTIKRSISSGFITSSTLWMSHRGPALSELHNSHPRSVHRAKLHAEEKSLSFSSSFPFPFPLPFLPSYCLKVHADPHDWEMNPQRFFSTVKPLLNIFLSCGALILSWFGSLKFNSLKNINLIGRTSDTTISNMYLVSKWIYISFGFFILASPDHTGDKLSAICSVSLCCLFYNYILKWNSQLRTVVTLIQQSQQWQVRWWWSPLLCVQGHGRESSSQHHSLSTPLLPLLCFAITGLSRRSLWSRWLLLLHLPQLKDPHPQPGSSLWPQL